MILRDTQVNLKNDVYTAWQDPQVTDVMAVAATGFGKTVVMASVGKDFDVPTCAVAHRQELVSQIALAFNREEVPHAIIAPKAVIRAVIAAQMELHGRSYYNPRAHVRVAGIDTLVGYDQTDRWLSQVGLLFLDEGHHVLRKNKWGRGRLMFPNARALYFTAHAERADGKGLGVGADGLVHRLVVGPSGRDCINRGYLTDYRIVCPPLDVDTSDIEVGAGGELNMKQTRQRVHDSKTIVGSVVGEYKRRAEGELGITFAIDIEECKKIAVEYERQGIPAAIITAKTPIAERAVLMRKFRQRQIIQLVNVDVLGEGTDVPACTVISMARPTASFQLCAQQFGRMLRLFVSDELARVWHLLTDQQRLRYIAESAKPKGILIDHVGNIAVQGGAGRHGLPDRPRAYSLERRERRSQQPDDAIPLRTCLNPECWEPYEAVLVVCPHCGTPKPAPAPRLRLAPETVEGDLVELDPEVLREMRGEIDRIDCAPVIPRNVNAPTAMSIKHKHWERQRSQHELRKTISLWAGWQAHLGRPDRETYRRFFFNFGVDIATAQTLGAKEAGELNARISAQLAANNIVEASTHELLSVHGN